MPTKSTVVSMRIPTTNAQRLQRMARRMGRTASDTGALLVEEGLRRSEFAFVDFRDTPAGRQACIQGSSLAVWEVVLAVRDCDGDEAQAARLLDWAPMRIRAALNYAAAFPEEIETAIADSRKCDFSELSRLLPQIERFPVDA